MIHIGEEIQERLRKKRMKVIDFSRKIDTNRNNVYDIFSRKSIDSGLLLKISEALEFDFFRLYSIYLSKNSLVQQLEDPLEELKNYEDLKRKSEKLEQENSLLSDRIRDKELIIQLMRRSDS
jgi:cell division protein FtsB